MEIKHRIPVSANLKEIVMRRVILLLMLAILSGSANAETGFTCEKIKDKATRKSCLDDRGNTEKAAAAAKEREAAAVASEKEREAAKKAEISSSCSLSGRSVIECTFKNSGNKKGSSCEKVVLMPKKLDDSYVPQIFRLLGSDKWKSDQASMKITLRGLLAAENRNTISTAPRDLDLGAGILNSEKMVFADNEICSGIVESGDIRQVSANVSFFGQSVNKICGGAGDVWSVICSFATVPPEKVAAMMNEELNK